MSRVRTFVSYLLDQCASMLREAAHGVRVARQLCSFQQMLTVV